MGVKEFKVSFKRILFREGPLFFIGGGYLFRKKNCLQAVVG